MPQQVRIGWRSGSSSQTAASIVTSGLILNLDAGNVSSYSGTGTTWTDLSSTGNNGTLVNGTGYSSSNGGALVFDGVNDYVNITNKSKIINTDFTYDFWFKVNSNPNTYQTLISQINGDYADYSILGKNRSGAQQGNIYFQLQGFTLQSNLSATDLIAAGNINYTAVAKKEGTYYKMYLYRNGVLDNSLNTTLSTLNMDNWLNIQTNIGRNSSNNGFYGEYLGGNIYVGRVYNRALSTTEITQNFDATKTRFGYSNLDTDAQAFLTAASIMDSTQASAVNTLVTSLKTAGIWTKMKALYPFVGGSAASHKFNLKDPRDLDAAFRLQFNGGWTHTSTGATPNGTTGYANTYLNPFVVFGNGQSHLVAGSTHSLVHVSKYSRTNSIPSNGYDGVYSNGGSQASYMFFGWSSTYGSPNGYATLNGWALTGTRSAVTLGNRTDGLFVVNRDGFTSLKSFRNNTLISTDTNDIRSYNETGLQLNLNPNQVFFIGARNDAYDLNLHSFAYNNFETSFQSIGWSLTDAETTALNTAVQTFQTDLGRAV